jgi:hypothetical protein
MRNKGTDKDQECLFWMDNIKPLSVARQHIVKLYYIMDEFERVSKEAIMTLWRK